MRLNEFVEKSLTQIIDGVRKAQEYAEEKEALVNPRGLHWKQDPGEYHLTVDMKLAEELYLIPQMIDFDVAVTVAEGEEIKVAAGLFGGALGLGAQDKISDANTIVSRLRFAVPMILPRMRKHPKRATGAPAT
jgi:hypothetical protein